MSLFFESFQPQIVLILFLFSMKHSNLSVLLGYFNATEVATGGVL